MDPRAPATAADPALVAAVADALGPADALQHVHRLILAAAAVRPASGWEIARAVDAVAPGMLEGQEGGLYPVLAGLAIRGLLEARWEEDAGRRPRRVYGRPGAPAPVPGTGPALPVPASAAPARLHDAARECARGVPGPFERESMRAEILSHLEASTAAYARLGLESERAALAALRDFGDTWKVRTDLGRVHRGRAVVVYPRTWTERLHALAIYDLVPLAVVLCVLLLVRWQVVQAYNIPTKSMEPTLHGEEEDPDFILVDKTAFLRREPERWDCVVFYPPPRAERRRPGESPSAFVKRCVGLGGDTLDIRGGDLYVNGRLARRPLAIEDAMMVPLYDQARDLREPARTARADFTEDPGFPCAWRRDRPGDWSILDGRFVATPEPGGRARLRFGGKLVNAFEEPDGRRVDSDQPAGDLEVRFVAEAGAEGTTFGADLTEGAPGSEERHELRIGPRGVTLTSGGRTWTSPLARSGTGHSMEVAFRNVDDRLTVRIDGEVVLRVDQLPRTSVPKEPAPGGVELVAEGGPATFRGVRISRDIVYLLLPGDDRWPRRVPEGCFFMLGDNTANSHDSRAWDSVERKDLIGHPFLVVYPPSRAKVLR